MDGQRYCRGDTSTTYNPNINPSLYNSFAGAAFRFGHSMINGMFKLISQRRNNREDDSSVTWLLSIRNKCCLGCLVI